MICGIFSTMADIISGLFSILSSVVHKMNFIVFWGDSLCIISKIMSSEKESHSVKLSNIIITFPSFFYMLFVYLIKAVTILSFSSTFETKRSVIADVKSKIPKSSKSAILNTVFTTPFPILIIDL